MAGPVFFPEIAYGTASDLLPGDPFVGLHCEHLPASTVVHDFEQRTMSTSANGASDALGMGPSTGYILISVITVLAAIVFVCMSSLHAVVFIREIHMHVYAITNLLMLFFWIKLIMKMSKFLTIQKPYLRQFSVSGFAAALKPNKFDDKNFMIWHAKMVLWLTAMNCYHAA